MICSIGELAGLFQKSRNLEDFLQTAVSVIAYHMNAAVCSIYLQEDSTDELLLRANQGLSAGSVGHVRLKQGEGLTGLALKELRPICEGYASRNPSYKYFPETSEEKYQSFLAVPILNGLRRVGVLVVQDVQANYFNANDIKALRAIAAQLASTIENAQLLMSLHQERARPDAAVPRDGVEGGFLKGKGASQGVACGRVVLKRSGDDAFLSRSEAEGSYTREQFEESLLRAERQLEQLQDEMEKQMMDVASLIFSAQLLILKDGNFSGKMRAQMESGCEVSDAVVAVANEYIRLFASSSNPRLREKVQDVKDIGLRLLNNLKGSQQERAGYEGCIIVGREILPSDILKFSAMGAAGLVLTGGAGATAHVAILARSLELPAVVLSDEQAEMLTENVELILDANQGNVFVDPSVDVRSRYEVLCNMRGREGMIGEQVAEETRTSDGTRVHLLANINLVSDLACARAFKAEGVGLYRSEFPFIIRTSFPTEGEQCPIYRRILDEMEGRSVVFRTLDIGGDKML
ncbi:MAG: phosphoenolpyruvate-utilizing N-terminal domain-containing protein, partial [Kiritimatiellae bacterium]|nr:phosphoenolpyruvate-utilizing N-terminal domain-containing protein [Kiritimatiellia bacterium]